MSLSKFNIRLQFLNFIKSFSVRHAAKSPES
jgi:hypothetical protein